MVSIGLLLAFTAFLSWGFGDFFIQRSVRAIGNVTALFAIGFTGFVVLTPFVWSSVPSVLTDPHSRLLLLIAFVVTLIVAFVEFQSFKVGKLSVIEPVLTLELPLTVLIGVFFLREHLTGLQLALVGGVFAGVMLTVFRHQVHHWWQFFTRHRAIEAGVGLGFLGALMMTLTNVFTGLASQAAGPLTAIWFIHSSLALSCLIIVIARRQVRQELVALRRSWRVVLGESVFDNMAWIAYASTVTYLPIALTIGITESYVALASLLGIVMNRERLQRHQYAGMGLALVSAVLLGIFSQP